MKKYLVQTVPLNSTLRCVPLPMALSTRIFCRRNRERKRDREETETDRHEVHRKKSVLSAFS